MDTIDLNALAAKAAGQAVELAVAQLFQPQAGQPTEPSARPATAAPKVDAATPKAAKPKRAAAPKEQRPKADGLRGKEANAEIRRLEADGEIEQAVALAEGLGWDHVAEGVQRRAKSAKPQPAPKERKAQKQAAPKEPRAKKTKKQPKAADGFEAQVAQRKSEPTARQLARAERNAPKVRHGKARDMVADTDTVDLAAFVLGHTRAVVRVGEADAMADRYVDLQTRFDDLDLVFDKAKQNGDEATASQVAMLLDLYAKAVQLLLDAQVAAV